jgi:hypothetical protein
MAYKTFANGFPLPASDLNNFLMNQSVIVFADSAARGTAIPSPVTGMLTYLEDTNAYESWNGSAFVALVEDPDLTALIPKSTVTTSQDLIVADGASSVTRLGVGTDDQVLSVVAGEVAWADAGGGGSELIASGTLSGSSITLSSIPQTYQDLVLKIHNQVFSVSNNYLKIRMNGETGSVYSFFQFSANWSDNMNGTASTAIEGSYHLPGSGDPLSGKGTTEVTIMNYSNDLTLKYFKTELVEGYLDNGTTRYQQGSTISSCSVTDALTSLTIFTNSGVWNSGTYALYGVN